MPTVFPKAATPTCPFRNTRFQPALPYSGASPCHLPGSPCHPLPCMFMPGPALRAAHSGHEATNLSGCGDKNRHRGTDMPGRSPWMRSGHMPLAGRSCVTFGGHVLGRHVIIVRLAARSAGTAIQHGAVLSLAEAVRFELTNGCPLPVFKTGAIDHSATLPATAFGTVHSTASFEPCRMPCARQEDGTPTRPSSNRMQASRPRGLSHGQDW